VSGRADSGRADAARRQRAARTLLASTSFAALLIGGGTPAALAQCPTVITGTTSGCFNFAGPLTGITVTNATVTGDIVNNGTISPNGITVDNQSTINGSINNAGALIGGVSSGGLIAGTGVGIVIGVPAGSLPGHPVGGGVFPPTFAGGITNSGTITISAGGLIHAFGRNSGIAVGQLPTFLGGITNSGTITGALFGINVDAVLNGGSPVPNGGLTSFDGGITNTGAIVGGASRPTGIGIQVQGVSTFSGGISNAGTITSFATGILVGNVLSFAGGITSTGTISVSNVGIWANGNSENGPGGAVFSNGVVNGGLIAARIGIQIGATSGLHVPLVSSFGGGVTNSGTITNNGTIAGGGTGILVTNVSTFSGGITNSGTIAGGNVGIWSENGPLLLNGISNGGLISAAKYGVRVGSASIIGVPSTATLALNVSSFGGGITNAGTIALSSSGVGSGIFVAGVSTFAGGIANLGTITGAGQGIQVGNGALNLGGGPVLSVATFAGGIVNAGTIAGAGAGTGIAVNSVSTFSNGITNAGVISAVANGLQIGSVQFGLLTVQNFSGGVTNSGTISATGVGIFLNGVSTFAGGVTNLGTIAGASTGIWSENGPVFLDGITNAGTISAAAVGIRVGPIGSSSHSRFTQTFTGGISNAGIISVGGNGVGILVDAALSFAGPIINSGTISAGGTGIWASGGVRGVAPSREGPGGIFNDGTIVAGNTGVRVGGAPPGFAGFGVWRTFSGGITNAGTISITGGGTGVFVAAVFTFQGGITNSGTIAAASSGIRVGVLQSGVPLMTSFSGQISNSGLISVGGSGVGINLQWVSSFVGGISNSGTIFGGTGIWAGGAGGQSENGPGGIFNGGAIAAGQLGVQVGSVVAGQSMLSKFAGGISNAGTITVADAGVGVLVDGVLSYRGGITNSGAIVAATGIKLGAVATLLGAIANTGTISGTGGTAIDVTAAPNAITIDQAGGLIAGAIKLSAFNDTVNITGGAVLGDIIGQGTNGTVNFDPGSGNSFNYANVITGVNAVNVLSGTLFDNNTIAAATVTVNGGATLAPGLPGSIGSLAITGNLAFQPGAFYLVQVGGSGASIANVTGTTSLAGTVQAAFAPGVSLSKQYDILHAAGGLGGSTFDGLSTINLSPMLSASLSYGPNDVFLDFSALGLGPNNGSINDQNVSAAIANVFNNNGTLPPGFGTLFGLGNATLLNALNQLDGEVGAGGGAQAGFHLTNSFLSLMLNGFFGDRSTLGGFGAASAFAAEPQRPPLAASAFAALDQVAGISPVDARRTFWASAYGGQATAAGDAALGSNTTRTSATGLAAGLDWRATPDTVVGFALAGAGTGWNVGSGLGSGSSDAFQAGIYGTQQFGASYLATAASYAWYAMNTKRTVTVSGVDTLTAGFNANNIGARIEAGHRFVAPWSIAVTPYAAAQAQAFFLPAYSESASSGSSQFALGYAADTATATRAELGSWLDTRALLGDVQLFARLAWAHDWNGDTRATAFFQTLPGASFVVNGAAAPKDVALVSAGAAFRLSPNASVSAKFDGEFANAYSSYAGSATFRYGW
jgi:uncharacterized protein with beta-barrel porin domain